MIAVKRIRALGDAALENLCVRGRATDPGVDAAVQAIIADVRGRGDEALRDLAKRFDGADLDALEVPASTWSAALAALEPELRGALEAAARAITGFHAPQRPEPTEWSPAPGIRLGRRPDPLRRVGVYVPGGRAAYPSSVLMGVVPARIAGVEEVIVCSPPGPGGEPAPLVMAACAIAGADRLFALGGAGAIAALALGTASVPRVDRVIGPGNAYVAAAKRQLASDVGIDSPAGPSELLVVADADADPAVVAREMIAQAEHDPDAAVVVVATAARLARAVAAELEARVPREPRRAVVEAALRAGGAILVAADQAEALAFAERYAPEHLLLLVRRPAEALARVRCAGTVFLGPHSSAAFGDYATGANHVLPTGGQARSYSGLSVLDFVRWTTWQEVDARGAEALARVAVPLARAEGLPAHAAAAAAAAASGAGQPALDTAAPAPPEIAPAVGRGSPPARAPYRSMPRYAPPRPRLALDLSANTNLWGACPAAVEALREAAERPVGYPTPYADALREALADAWSLAPEQVTTGCGSDDLIDSAIRAFCAPGGVVAYPAPTFPMAEVFSRMNDARPRPVPLEDGSLDGAALEALRAADVVYLCRPNNPTGALLTPADVRRVLERARGVVLVDEAYAEFAGESMLAPALESGRGAVLRTFSKAYGLAGLRVGYALGPEPVVRAIELSRGPYKVGGPAEAAAVAAVREGGAWVREVVRQAVASRERLRDALLARGLRCPPAAANFLLVGPGPGGAAPAGWGARVRAGLAARGIGVRAFDALPRFGDAIRVTVGPWAEMERFLDALDPVLAAGGEPVRAEVGAEVR